jgi:hypothetical protein
VVEEVWRGMWRGMWSIGLRGGGGGWRRGGGLVEAGEGVVS